MDIEQRLREMLVLRDPGTPFTEDVMSRVAEVPGGQAGDGVVQLAEARTRRRGRRILFGTLVAVGAAAAIPSYFLYSGGNAPATHEAVALVPSGFAAVLQDDGVRTQPTEPGESAAAAAAVEDCLDPDVLHGLLLPGAGEGFRISADPPPELADFKVPRELAWVGASERGVGTAASSLSAVYRSRLAPQAAQAATAAALATAGWTLQDLGRVSSPNVFSTDTFQQGDTYCRDEQSLTLSGSALDGVTYVVLATRRRAGGGAGSSMACEASPRQPARSAATLDAYLPALHLPRDPATGAAAATQGTGGGGGGDTQRRMNVSFTLQDSPDNVARHFARQMAAQGWSVESDWNGTGTAGSSWRREADAGTVLRATLAVSAFDGGRFTVVFHMARTK